MNSSLIQNKPLGEVLIFKNGKSIKPGGTGSYPVYGSNGLIGGSDSYKEENAIIIGRVGAYCGSVAYQKGKFWASDNTIVASPRSPNHDVRFFLYLLKGMNLNRWAGGAAQPLLTQSILKQVEAPIPDIEIQKEIASILSAYDDLIENNTRRIKILEEMARSLYREWFINFRFPGHEKVKMVNAPLGKIPKGWEVVKFTDIAEVLSGGTPKTKESEYWNGDIPFFTPKDATSDFYVSKTEKNITDLGLSKCSSQLYSKDTVFITARGTVGKVVMPAVDMAMNQSCYALVGRAGVSQHFLFFLTRATRNTLKKHTGGATFGTIIVDTFKRFDVIRPSDEVIHLFTERVIPILEKTRNLLYQNTKLHHTRDLLLLELITGNLINSENNR